LTRFDRDTALAPAGEGAFEARIDPGWFVVVGPNGGYLAAILLRALTLAVGDASRAPRSLTIHYTAPPEAGPARVETRVERRGGALTSASCRLLQNDRLLARAMGAFSRPHPGSYSFREVAPPEVPPPEACPPRPRPPEAPRIAERYETRWALGSPPMTGGERALCGGWIRFEEPRAVDALALAAFSDALPPALFSRLADPAIGRGLPTVDLTLHFRAELPLPGARADDFTLCVFRSRLARDGFVEEDGELFSREGELLAQSRQLALVR
jgi:acyl-CoA thioesterase